ncbi:hypothetical protein M9458_007047, partial [Cirrhinus mrigala]
TRLRLGHRNHLLRLGPLNFLPYPGSSALCLCPGLLSYLLCRHRPFSTMAPPSLSAINHFAAANLLCLEQGNRSLEEHLQ